MSNPQPSVGQTDALPAELPPRSRTGESNPVRLFGRQAPHHQGLCDIEPTTGIEPVTSTLAWWRATDCATSTNAPEGGAEDGDPDSHRPAPTRPLPTAAGPRPVHLPRVRLLRAESGGVEPQPVSRPFRLATGADRHGRITLLELLWAEGGGVEPHRAAPTCRFQGGPRSERDHPPCAPRPGLEPGTRCLTGTRSAD